MLDPHTENVFVSFSSLGSSVAMHLSSKLGTAGPHRGPVKLVCPSVYPSVYLVVRIAFWKLFVWPVEFKLTKFKNSK